MSDAPDDDHEDENDLVASRGMSYALLFSNPMLRALFQSSIVDSVKKILTMRISWCEQNQTLLRLLANLHLQLVVARRAQSPHRGVSFYQKFLCQGQRLVLISSLTDRYDWLLQISN